MTNDELICRAFSGEVIGDGQDQIRLLTLEVRHLRESLRSYEDQFVWLAEWCKDRTGVENNKVIGNKGWPKRLVEVVAQAVDRELDRLRGDLMAAEDAAHSLADDARETESAMRDEMREVEFRAKEDGFRAGQEGGWY